MCVADTCKAGKTLLLLMQDQMNSVARFLDARGRPQDALEVATDPDYRFELAVQLGKLDTALEIAEGADSEGKWRQLSELAMSSGKLQVGHAHPHGSHVTSYSSHVAPT